MQEATSWPESSQAAGDGSERVERSFLPDWASPAQRDSGASHRRTPPRSAGGMRRPYACMATDASIEMPIYPEVRFGGFSRRDGAVAFYVRVNALLRPDMRVLDYGCGVGSHFAVRPTSVRSLQYMRNKVRQVIGTDVDSRAAANPTIDAFAPISPAGVELPDASIDICICEWGLEHFENPAAFFREAHRLLTPNGYLCIRTPNALHYSSIVARLLPFRLHTQVRQVLKHFHDEADVFPVRYRCNLRGQLQRALRRADFDAVVLRHCGPSHLVGAGTALGWVGEAIELLSPRIFWHELHAFARKCVPTP
jgi:SAM-dependent methyltransferase